MSQARRMLVVMAMTTALCADQIVVAAPTAAPRPVEIAQMAQRLVSRLSQNLRNTVPTTALCQPRTAGRSEDATRPAIAWATPASLQHLPTHAFQFRLPPPLA